MSDVGKQVSIYCPNCVPLVKLVVRKNQTSGSLFLGCPNHPRCKHTQELPEHIRMEMLGQPRLL